MSAEAAFIESLRALATDEAARGLIDDAAVLQVGGERLVLTHDMIVEGVHYLPSDPPADVAWKLVAVNLSDLAAKGARPLGALLGFTLGDKAWDRAFAEGLRAALAAFDLPLLGGDTVALPSGAPRVLGLTAIGRAGPAVPSRSGAQPGHELYVTGTIGDAGAGLDFLSSGSCPEPEMVERYRRPAPRLAAGQELAASVSAMMDVSDGLLVDVTRLLQASGCAADIDLERIPLSKPFQRWLGDDAKARLAAATAGDDYELLFAAPQEAEEEILGISRQLGLPITYLGILRAGEGISLSYQGGPVPLPDKLGFEHG